MSSLNIMCCICGEFYKATDKVYSTTICGHLFHQQCLMRWLARSHSCPQCRRSCHQRVVHRVYLNFGERTSAEEEDELVQETNVPNWVMLDESTSVAGPEPVPAGAIKAGVDSEGNDAYIARAYFNDDLLPANYIPAKGGAYVPWSCRAHLVRNEVEILLDCKYDWVAASDGSVPPNAIITGYTESGENLYTGRAVVNGLLLPGKVHPSHRVLYMPHEGNEINTKNYEVLVHITDASGEQPQNVN